jgi:hypothetical protein
MNREVIGDEPPSTFLERWKAPTSVVTRHGDTVYVPVLLPLDPGTGEVARSDTSRPDDAEPAQVGPQPFDVLRAPREAEVAVGAHQVQRVPRQPGPPGVPGPGPLVEREFRAGRPGHSSAPVGRLPKIIFPTMMGRAHSRPGPIGILKRQNSYG